MTIEADRPTALRRVALCVTDTGRGMTAAQLAHAFEPFNRLGAEGSGIEGTGIGLAIVKALVERMGGASRCAAARDRAASSRLELPAADASVPAPIAPKTSAAPAEPPPRPNGRLLYIEDNAGQRC